jgi:predicted KAP-like P-loop ATPase
VSHEAPGEKPRKGWWNTLFGGSAEDIARMGEGSDGGEPPSENNGAFMAEPEPLIDNDSPIRTPAEDLFGVDRFAAMVARGLAAQRDADGTVIALHGPWGSGKSSAVNLALHHLAETADGEIEVIAFNPWWFAGSSALANAFFQTIGSALNRTLREHGSAALGDFFARLKSFNTYADAAARFASDGVAQAVAQLAFGERSIEDEHRKLADALRAQPKSFLIVIDDIDRLSPDEALLIFGLVKSVGRLPRVSYLLAFDRILIEQLIEQHFPSEGKLYLEKIVQAMFDLPLPPDDVLRNMVLEQTSKLFTVGEDDIVRFMNLFYDIVAPNLTSPRQAVRLNGALRVAWPSVEGEVDAGDFLSTEALRLFHPALYRNVRQNPDLCCDGQVAGRRDEERVAAAEEILFRNVDAASHDFARLALQRLFPKLQSVWGNMHYGRDWDDVWKRSRLVASEAHFPIYFQYGLDEGAVPKPLRDELVARAGDREFIMKKLQAGVGVGKRSGGTQAAAILEELNLHATDVARESVEPLLTAIFAVVDEIATEADQARGFSIANNPLRVHWLINRLLMDRFSIEERSEILVRASDEASPIWLIDVAQRCFRPYDPDREKKDRTVLVTEDAANLLMQRAHDRVRALAASGELIDTSEPSAALWFLWHSGKKGKAAAREIANDWLADDRATIKLARSVTSTGWSQGGGFDAMGDRVARSFSNVHPESLAKLLDAERLRARVVQLRAAGDLAPMDMAVLDRFTEGWEHDRREREED